MQNVPCHLMKFCISTYTVPIPHPPWAPPKTPHATQHQMWWYDFLASETHLCRFTTHIINTDFFNVKCSWKIIKRKNMQVYLVQWKLHLKKSIGRHKLWLSVFTMYFSHMQANIEGKIKGFGLHNKFRRQIATNGIDDFLVKVELSQRLYLIRWKLQMQISVKTWKPRLISKCS